MCDVTMGKQRMDFLQRWLGLLLGIATSSIVSSRLFGSSFLEAFFLCVVISYFLSKKIAKKDKPRPILI